MGTEVRFPEAVRLLLGEMRFRPTPPGDAGAGDDRLRLPERVCDVDVPEDQMRIVTEALAAGALNEATVRSALRAARVEGEPLMPQAAGSPDGDWFAQAETSHQLDRLGLVAVSLVDRAQRELLTVEPLTEIVFRLTPRARAALALGWAAMAHRGFFPLPPRGHALIERLHDLPLGAMHFVSASDLDAGYRYTMGVALSPEAQARGTMEVGYGLDGELIVPGQAVSPIPPFLAMATRLFAASVPTSSNISEEEQSIPVRNLPYLSLIDDLEPKRGGRFKPPVRPRTTDDAITDLRVQLSGFHRAAHRRDGRGGMPHGPELATAAQIREPQIGAAYDVTGMTARQVVAALTPVLADPVLAEHKDLMALYLDVEQQGRDRVDDVCAAIDAAKRLGLRLVAVADDAEDEWLPNLLEYLDPDELNAVADHADEAGVIVVDGRPVDPVYTAATAAQRIQSVYATLSVDILKMGMWLCLDALTARKVWREIISNPHIPERMLLMPIGIVEPWSAFVDNRDPGRTARPIADPFEKIVFMIEEAAVLGVPSLLTDTRHKEKWVLLGRKDPDDEPHPRERLQFDPETGDPLGRTRDSAIPLLSWREFMACERRARAAGIMLGQAGSIEAEQAFRIISEVTLDAARAHRDPATAIWTAETERVLRVRGETAMDLQRQRGSDVSAFLAVVNRGHESHAKLDGWLRYLAECRGDDDRRENAALRAELDGRRERLGHLLTDCLNRRRDDPAGHQAAWEEFRAAYLEYHNLIKGNFVRVQRQVQDLWTQATEPAHV